MLFPSAYAIAYTMYAVVMLGSVARMKFEAGRREEHRRADTLITNRHACGTMSYRTECRRCTQEPNPFRWSPPPDNPIHTSINNPATTYIRQVFFVYNVFRTVVVTPEGCAWKEDVSHYGTDNC